MASPSHTSSVAVTVSTTSSGRSAFRMPLKLRPSFVSTFTGS